MCRQISGWIRVVFLDPSECSRLSAVSICLTLQETAELFSTVAAPLSIPTSKVGEPRLLHILASTCRGHFLKTIRSHCCVTRSHRQIISPSHQASFHVSNGHSCIFFCEMFVKMWGSIHYSRGILLQRKSCLHILETVFCQIQALQIFSHSLLFAFSWFLKVDP